jgi:hypothetical protein
LIGVIVFGLVFGAAIFGMFLGRNLRVLEQKVNASDKLAMPTISICNTRCYGSLSEGSSERRREPESFNGVNGMRREPHLCFMKGKAAR